MKFLTSLITLCLVLFLSAPSLRADLAGDIRKVLADKLLAKSTVAVQVVRLTERPEECQLLFDQNGRTPLIPASNMKIVTSSAALHVLSPEFRFRTFLIKRGDDLIVWGDGDPTLGDATLMDRIGWSQTAVFEDWIRQLRARGITSANRLIIDDSIFDEEFLHPQWQRHQGFAYGAQVGGLNFNTNIVEFSVIERKGLPTAWSIRPQTSYINVTSNTCTAGTASAVSLPRTLGTNNFAIRGTVKGAAIANVPIHDPSMYAGTIFADLLKANGFTLAGGVLRDRTTREQYDNTDPASRDETWQILCVYETPLIAAVNRCNKDSMNMYAEALTKRLGAAMSPGGGTWSGGAAVIGEFLRKLGVSEGEFRIDDGSGLSRENLITAHAMNRCLMNNFYSPNRDAFIKSLPIANIDGTLEKRFDQKLRGRVFAKTGFIANCSSLSGYVRARDGQWYAFSILMNGIPDFSNSSIKPLQEKIVEAIDNAAAKSANP